MSCDATTLEKQGAGCIAKAVALRYGKMPTVSAIFETINRVMKPYVQSMYDKTNDAATILETS